MHGLYDIMDIAIAEKLDVDVETYVKIIETKCSMREANYIINVIFGERHDKLESAKAMFNKYLNEEDNTDNSSSDRDDVGKI